jgi:soluble lytic murein transglycosylase-like protein
VARSVGIDSALLHAVVQVESSYNPNAVSPKGAQGLMQLMPATAQQYGVPDPFDPLANLDGGARYLRDLLLQFGRLHLALAAYNAGAEAVRRYGNTIPPYAETQAYVRRVMERYAALRQVAE